jgi:hypothetical protein
LVMVLFPNNNRSNRWSNKERYILANSL